MFCRAKDGMQDLVLARGVGDVYEKQAHPANLPDHPANLPDPGPSCKSAGSSCKSAGSSLRSRPEGPSPKRSVLAAGWLPLSYIHLTLATTLPLSYPALGHVVTIRNKNHPRTRPADPLTLPIFACFVSVSPCGHQHCSGAAGSVGMSDLPDVRRMRPPHLPTAYALRCPRQVFPFPPAHPLPALYLIAI